MSQIRYRREPSDPEMELTEVDEYLAMRALVQDAMQDLTGERIVDTLLLFTNVCEHRSSLHADSSMSIWYGQLGHLLRSALEHMTNTTPHTPLPNVAFDDQTLYWDSPAQMH